MLPRSALGAQFPASRIRSGPPPHPHVQVLCGRIQNPESRIHRPLARASTLQHVCMCTCTYGRIQNPESTIQHPPTCQLRMRCMRGSICGRIQNPESRMLQRPLPTGRATPVSRIQDPQSGGPLRTTLYRPASFQNPESTALRPPLSLPTQPVSRIQNPSRPGGPVPSASDPTSFQNPESKPPRRSGPLRTRPDQFPESRCLETEPAKSRIQKNRICKLVLGTWRHAALK